MLLAIFLPHFHVIFLPGICLSYVVVALFCKATGYPRPPSFQFLPIAFGGFLLGLAIILSMMPDVILNMNLFYGLCFLNFFVLYLVLIKIFIVEINSTNSWLAAILLSIACTLPAQFAVFIVMIA